MKKVLMFLMIAILLTSFAFAGITGSVAQDNKEKVTDGTQNQEQNKITTPNQNKGTLTQSQVKNIVRERNKLKIHNVEDTSECPANCTCSGATTKCWLNGQREMTIVAGKSGNTIVQVKGVNASTTVTLYKTDGKIYGQFKNNVTKRILSPEQVEEKIKEKLNQEDISIEDLELNDDGYYKVQTKKKARLFLFIPVKEKVEAQITAENGEVKIRNPWWGFLAKDAEEPIVGGSCGTVSPDSRDECCQNRGYEVYDSEKGECVFSDS